MWICHAITASSQKYIKKLFNDVCQYKVEGVRPRGRPRKTWGEILGKKTVKHVD